jgi:hypothetical protein
VKSYTLGHKSDLATEALCEDVGGTSSGHFHTIDNLTHLDNRIDIVDRKRICLHPPINANSVYKSKLLTGSNLLHFDCSIDNSYKMVPIYWYLVLLMAYSTNYESH